MSLLFSIEKLKDNYELVICDSELSRHAHKELFHCNDDSYITTNKTINAFDTILGILNSHDVTSRTCLSRIHLALNWKNLLQISLWQTKKPTTGDVFTLLRNAGITSQELQPFRTADINDIFPYLYYGKRFDILRKICHAAKRQMESHLKEHSIRMICHLVADDTKKIVASSL